MTNQDFEDEDEAPPSSRGWDADAYHRISLPQTAWGLRVLARLELAGDETVLDAGCGTGKLTASLCARLPRGRVIALDASDDMLRVARATLAPFAERVTFVQQDLAALTLEDACSVIFSTATFHWVLDHARLFQRLHRALVFGGRLHAQCGGGANLRETYARAASLAKRHDFAPHFVGFTPPTNFSTAEDAKERLAAAGFVDVHAELEDAPTVFPDRASYRAFLEKVVLTPHLERLHENQARAAFLDAITDLAEADATPFALDYVRLNLRARKA